MERWRMIGLAAVALGLAAAGAAVPKYPEGFRSWAHVTSGIVGPKSPAAPKYEGVHHIYANALALEGYRTGRFPDGAVLVYDQHAAAPGGPDAQVAGPRKFVDMMVMDRARYPATDGWGYAEFTWPDLKRVEEIDREPLRCHACHKKLAAPDHVFSSYEP